MRQTERPDFIKHFTEIQQNPEESHYPESQELHSVGSAFGKAFGLKKLGIHHELVKPGQRTSWPHAEQDEEEFVYVIDGNPDVWINGYLHSLKPGDGVGLPSGTGVSHTFINNTESDVRLLVVGEKSKKDSKIYYPLHPNRREQCKENWWHDVPKYDIGPHDGLPDKLRTAGEIYSPNFTGEVIVESLADQAVLMKLEPFSIKARVAEMPNEEIKTWHIRRYCIDEKTLLKLIPQIEQSIGVGSWYVHFYSDVGDKLYVIFKGKHFLVPKRQDQAWEKMIQFGESIGVGRRWTETIPVSFKV